MKKSCIQYLKFFYLFHYCGAQKYYGVLFLLWIILTRPLLSLPSNLVGLLLSLALFLLEKLQHLEDISEEVIHLYLHAFTI